MSDKAPSQFCGVPVRENPGMHPLAWMAYDADGAVVECGMLGKSLRNSEAMAARIECGSEFYRQLCEYVEAMASK
jgi:hypothetical protein